MAAPRVNALEAKKKDTQLVFSDFSSPANTRKPGGIPFGGTSFEKRTQVCPESPSSAYASQIARIS
jgi:hypothetical protein